MKRKTLLLVLTIEAVICFAAAIWGSSNASSAFGTVMSFPFVQIGNLLRLLSLSGSLGNIIAIVHFVAIGAIPIAYLLKRILTKKAKAEDTLLIVMSALLFLSLYWNINPVYFSSLWAIGGPSAEFGAAILGSVTYSVLAGYIIFKAMRNLNYSGTGETLKYLKIFFAVTAVILVYSIFGDGISSLTARMAAIASTNTNTDPMLAFFPSELVNWPLVFTQSFVVFLFILNQIPSLINIAIVFWAIRLSEELMADRYGENVMTAANSLVSICKKSVVAIMLCTITGNLLQLIFSKWLLSSNFVTIIPLFQLALVLSMFLLAKYFAESKKIKTDNEQFI